MQDKRAELIFKYVMSSFMNLSSFPAMNSYCANSLNCQGNIEHFISRATLERDMRHWPRCKKTCLCSKPEDLVKWLSKCFITNVNAYNCVYFLPMQSVISCNDYVYTLQRSQLLYPLYYLDMYM